MKISATMAEALATAHEHGGMLERRAGGFWTYPKCPCSERRSDVPTWYVAAGTVQALVTRGELEYTQHRETGWGKFPVIASIPKGKLHAEEA